MNEHVQDAKEGDGNITVSIFRNGRSRAVRIPKEFELEGDSAVMVQQPDGSILMRTALTAGLVEYLRQAEAWTGDDFAADDNDLAELPEVELE